MKRIGASVRFTVLFTLLLTWSASGVHAFCGFYLAKAEADLFNDASKVVIARNGNATTITMANDYRGDLHDFAMVVPVPEVLKREQIAVRAPELIDRIDAYTAPRLVEYPDFGSCARDLPAPLGDNERIRTANSLGVSIEAEYAVGEYDVTILSAKESRSLEVWLLANGYKIPQDAVTPLANYIAAGTKFLVARVNLTAAARNTGRFLRPLQISFQSERFMLPIQLGMLNASGPQDLFIFTLTHKGRVRIANYTTQNLPTDLAIPYFVRESFGAFYKGMFDRMVKDNGRRAVYLEYAWDMNWCDPCAADPLSVSELRALGVDWIADEQTTTNKGQVFVTRLHIRYDKESFPDDLELEVTEEQANFQSRFITTSPAPPKCISPDDQSYMSELKARNQTQASNLARITNWSIMSILEKMRMMR